MGTTEACDSKIFQRISVKRGERFTMSSTFSFSEDPDFDWEGVVPTSQLKLHSGGTPQFEFAITYSHSNGVLTVNHIMEGNETAAIPAGRYYNDTALYREDPLLGPIYTPTIEITFFGAITDPPRPPDE